MRIRDIEAAIAVHENGSFSKAAEALSTSQPAVSMAVQRLERHLNMVLFDRTGSGVKATPAGAAAIKAFLKITDIFDELLATSATTNRMKMGVSPLLSGRDVVAVLEDAFADHAGGIEVEFIPSDEIQSRQDLDVRITLPSLRKKSTFCVDLPSAWVGVDNGIFIYSNQESEVWQMARSALINSGYAVKKQITVNDCGYAYHMAAAGAGFTPCVLTRNIAFRDKTIDTLPPLPTVRLDIFASFERASRLRELVCPLAHPA